MGPQRNSRGRPLRSVRLALEQRKLKGGQREKPVEGRGRGRHWLSFNGATPYKPVKAWNHPIPSLDTVTLQWGHSVIAVEGDLAAHCLACVGGASMGPQRNSRGRRAETEPDNASVVASM